MDRYRILCIDDDLMMLKSLEDILTAADFQISLAKSGSQALKLLEKGIAPALILLDVDMPDLDGYETFERIQNIESCSKIPVIFLTGMNMPDFEIRGIEIGAADYIVKPFQTNVLIARIKGQLRKLKQDEDRQQASQEAHREVLSKLNESEQRIALYIAEGFTNQEIADRTHYSYNYVKKMSSSILAKLNLEKRADVRNLLKS